MKSRIVFSWIKYVSIFLLISLLLFYNDRSKFIFQEITININSELSEEIKNKIKEPYFFYNYKNFKTFLLSYKDKSPFKMIREISFWFSYRDGMPFALVADNGVEIFLFDKYSVNLSFINNEQKEGLNSLPICFGSLQGWSFGVNDESVIYLNSGYKITILSIGSKTDIIKKYFTCR